MTEAQIASYRRWVDLETRGEAICAAHARQGWDDGQRAKWMLLAELESTTKHAVVHYLRTNGIIVAESAKKRHRAVPQRCSFDAWLYSILKGSQASILVPCIRWDRT